MGGASTRQAVCHFCSLRAAGPLPLRPPLPSSMCQKPLGSKKTSKSTKAKPVLAPGALGACPALDPFPYPHVRAPPGLFDRRALLAVREELASLQRTFKETDLFKVYQTGDLANLDAANPEHTAALPSTIALRAALYSPAALEPANQLSPSLGDPRA